MATATTSDALFTHYMNYILKGTAWTPTKSVAIALLTAVPSSDGTGIQEVPANADTKYTRVSVSTDGAGSGWQGPGSQNLEYSNKNEITFPVPGTQGWGTIAGCGIFSEPTPGSTAGSELMWIGRIATPKPVSSGDGAPRILPGQLKITRASC